MPHNKWYSVHSFEFSCDFKNWKLLFVQCFVLGFKNGLPFRGLKKCFTFWGDPKTLSWFLMFFLTKSKSDFWKIVNEIDIRKYIYENNKLNIFDFYKFEFDLNLSHTLGYYPGFYSFLNYKYFHSFSINYIQRNFRKNYETENFVK